MTLLFGLLGRGIGYTLSPYIHNTVFKLHNIDAEYQVLDIPEDELDHRIEDIFERFYGLNVTIPYKIKIIKYLDELTQEAEIVGAVNTIKTRNRRVGHNTDTIGIELSLRRNNVNIDGRRCLILGAGGAARAAAYVFHRNGAEKIVVCNRTRTRAEEMREHFKRRGIPIDVVEWERRNEVAGESEIIINCTPIGTLSEESPLDPDVFNREKTVIDMVYRPRYTKLLRDAAARGAKVVDGLTILIYQALEADRFWLNIDIRDDVFNAVEKVLEDLV
ncbi:MAG: shikimate dehydrogenase [Crenarchaeota archaeon]|nr:shikimate dehydrogenase [Thermoproteota archaeon]